MRLLFISQDFPPDVGGIQTYSWEMARRLSSRAERLEVVAPRRPGAARVDQDAPFPVTRLAGRQDFLPLSSIPVLPLRAYRLRATAALHAQWQTVGSSVLGRALTGWPQHIACAVHGRELLFNPAASHRGLSAAYDRLRESLLAQVDTFFPVSRYTATLLEDHGIPSNRMHIIPNGTDPHHFRPHDEPSLRQRLGLPEGPLLLTVGRLVPRKGIDTVLRALPTIAQSVPDVAYLVVGTGPDRSRLTRLARRLDVEARVKFVGQVEHETLPLYYSTADLFVMPAREAPPDVEGFGLVFLEANACGTPVIGARTGGIPDAILDGETGLLVPPASPEALADAASRILTTPDLAATLGRQGRRRTVHEANWNCVADRMYAALETALS